MRMPVLCGKHRRKGPRPSCCGSQRPRQSLQCAAAALRSNALCPREAEWLQVVLPLICASGRRLRLRGGRCGRLCVLHAALRVDRRDVRIVAPQRRASSWSLTHTEMFGCNRTRYATEFTARTAPAFQHTRIIVFSFVRPWLPGGGGRSMSARIGSGGGGPLAGATPAARARGSSPGTQAHHPDQTNTAATGSQPVQSRQSADPP
jgi:hypothetical protein